LRKRYIEHRFVIEYIYTHTLSLSLSLCLTGHEIRSRPQHPRYVAKNTKTFTETLNIINRLFITT